MDKDDQQWVAESSQLRTYDVDGSHIGHDAQHREHVLVLEFRPSRYFMLETLQRMSGLNGLNRTCRMERSPFAISLPWDHARPQSTGFSTPPRDI